VLKGYRMLRGPFFVADADADGDVGVPGVAGGQGGCLALQSWAVPEDGRGCAHERPIAYCVALFLFRALRPTGTSAFRGWRAGRLPRATILGRAGGWHPKVDGKKNYYK
jgi:hypothetical protein